MQLESDVSLSYLMPGDHSVGKKEKKLLCLCAQKNSKGIINNINMKIISEYFAFKMMFG